MLTFDAFWCITCGNSTEVARPLSAALTCKHVKHYERIFCDTLFPDAKAPPNSADYTYCIWFQVLWKILPWKWLVFVLITSEVWVLWVAFVVVDAAGRSVSCVCCFGLLTVLASRWKNSKHLGEASGKPWSMTFDSDFFVTSYGVTQCQTLAMGLAVGCLLYKGLRVWSFRTASWLCVLFFLLHLDWQWSGAAIGCHFWCTLLLMAHSASPYVSVLFGGAPPVPEAADATYILSNRIIYYGVLMKLYWLTLRMHNPAFTPTVSTFWNVTTFFSPSHTFSHPLQDVPAWCMYLGQWHMGSVWQPGALQGLSLWLSFISLSSLDVVSYTLLSNTQAGPIAWPKGSKENRCMNI